ncbi:MAG: alpha/beta hydrolase [Pseudomonadota bacterium]|nr:alpha/beta hydrolase [Pseudomonadota bacterium]
MLFDRFSRRDSMGLGAVGAALMLGAAGSPSRASTVPAKPVVRHRTVRVGELDIFYREAGRPDAPALLLLHGFPSSSHMFRNLIPTLADRFRLIAPDYPGFGFSQFPPQDSFAYGFEAYADLIADFLDVLNVNRFGLYIQDYGAPVGLRLALKRPDAVTFLIVQNGNAYEEGLSPGWAPLKAYWREPTAVNRDKLRGWLGADGTRLQYVAGLHPDQIELVSPELWSLDWALLQRPGNQDLQLDLFGDYGSNVALYPEIQKWFRLKQLPTLIAWGKNDPFFTEAGAKAYLRDLPNAELHLLDGSHFLLETHCAEVAALIRQFADRNRL